MNSWKIRGLPQDKTRRIEHDICKAPVYITYAEWAFPDKAARLKKNGEKVRQRRRNKKF